MSSYAVAYLDQPIRMSRLTAARTVGEMSGTTEQNDVATQSVPLRQFVHLPKMSALHLIVSV